MFWRRGGGLTVAQSNRPTLSQSGISGIRGVGFLTRWKGPRTIRGGLQAYAQSRGIGGFTVSSSIGERCHIRKGTEHGSEIGLVAESCLLTHIRYALFGGDQELLRFGDAEMANVINKRLSRDLLKESHEMPSAQPDDVAAFSTVSGSAK